MCALGVLIERVPFQRDASGRKGTPCMNIQAAKRDMPAAFDRTALTDAGSLPYRDKDGTMRSLDYDASKKLVADVRQGVAKHCGR